MDNVQRNAPIINQPLPQNFRESSDIQYGPGVKGTFRTHEKSLIKLAKEEII
jgi:hypothetical protein